MRMKDTIFIRTVVSKKGFSLIELITFIIIGGIILPTSIIAFTGSLGNFSVPDNQVKARFYAEQRMEDITSNAYLSVSVTGGDVVGASPETGFQRKWNICFVLAANPDQCAADQATDSNYKKIVVSVTMPDNNVYSVSTIISRRPKS